MSTSGSGLVYKAMTKFLVYMVLMVLIWPTKPVESFHQDHHCGEEEYLSGSVCCLNCGAGNYLKSPCTTEGKRGDCEECEDGTYTEHSNHLPQCFRCTQCRSDQELVRPCTHTQNAECQCKSGGFCAPDQACEMCKTCSRCERDEEIIRNCTSTTNTECKKTRLNPGFTSDQKSMTTPAILTAAVSLVIVVSFVVWVWKRRTRGSSNQPVGLKKQRCHDSRLTEVKTQRSSSAALILSEQLVDKNFPTLVPVNGEESLRKCFEYFEEIDVDYHKRFFRHLGLADNVIKSKEHLPYEDRIHELLNVWMEKAGKDASLHDLLRALLAINQRRTAETIKENAVHSGHYLCQY